MNTHDAKNLADALETTSLFLGQLGVVDWSAWLARNAHWIRQGHVSKAIKNLLLAFKGADSLNNLIIHPLNGHALIECEVREVNQELQFMLSDICECARKIAHELG